MIKGWRVYDARCCCIPASVLLHACQGRRRLQLHYWKGDESHCGHALDKVRHRLESAPLLANLVLSTNVYWLIQTYFRVRSLPYPGEGPALRYLRENEPRACALIESFYGAPDRAEKLRLSDELTEIALEPIGGPWRDRETLSFGTHTDAVDLRVTGDALLQQLLSGD